MMGPSLSFLLDEEEEEDARVDDDAVLEGWSPRKARLLRVLGGGVCMHGKLN